MNYWKIIFWILGILPVGFVVSITSFYFEAGQILGRLPYYDHPDPKNLSIYADYSPYVDWTAEIWLASFPLWILLTIIYLIVNKKNLQWAPIVISGTLQVLGISILLSGIFEWYID